MKEINPLELFKLKSGMSWKNIAKEIGIEVCALKQIRLNGSSATKVRTCIAIFNLTGLVPFDYLKLEGEETIKKAKSIWDYKLKD